MKISQYCSVCKSEYEMDVVPTGDDDGVLWLQCPVCKGYLPKVKSSLEGKSEDAAPATDDASSDPTGSEEPATPAAIEIEPEIANVDLEAISEKVPAVDDEAPEDGAETEEPAEDPAEGVELLETMDVSAAVPYRPWKTYEAGDVIHHLAWDDHGVVLDKEQLPGNRRVLKVRFSEAGLVRLIEDDGSRPV